MSQKIMMKKKAEAIIYILRQKGFKVSSLEDNGICYSSIIEHNEKTFGIFFYQSKYSNFIIMKIVIPLGSCEEVLYGINGLFVLEEDEVKAAEKIIEKINYMSKLNFKSNFD